MWVCRCVRACVHPSVFSTSANLIKFSVSFGSSNHSSSKIVTVISRRATVFLEQQMQCRIRRIIFGYDVVF